jgi:hypothetical protein
MIFSRKALAMLYKTVRILCCRRPHRRRRCRIRVYTRSVARVVSLNSNARCLYACENLSVDHGSIHVIFALFTAKLRKAFQTRYLNSLETTLMCRKFARKGDQLKGISTYIAKEKIFFDIESSMILYALFVQK